LPGASIGRDRAALPMTRRLVSSGGPWEATAGYSRAVVVGDACWVSGTTDAGPDGRSLHPGDVAAQTRAVLAIIGTAMDEAGFALADVVRIRMFVTDIALSGAVLAIIAEAFGSIRPAATLVQVSALMDPSLLVEIEAQAQRD
jgi:enamine deaminase RidA (YjgF/YER057c/UK114 family)